MRHTTTTERRQDAARPSCGCPRGPGILPSQIQSVLGYSPADVDRLNLRGELVAHSDGTICPDSLTRVMSGISL